MSKVQYMFILLSMRGTQLIHLPSEDAGLISLSFLSIGYHLKNVLTINGKQYLTDGSNFN